MQETQVQSLGQEDPLEKGMTTHSSIPAWRIPWTGVPVSEHLVMSRKIPWEKSQILCIVKGYLGEGNGNPLQYSCLENPINRGAWWATVHEVTKNQTRLRDSHFDFSPLGVLQ